MRAGKRERRVRKKRGNGGEKKGKEINIYQFFYVV